MDRSVLEKKSSFKMLGLTFSSKLDCWGSYIITLEPLAHRQNVVSLDLFYWYYFGRCSSELAQLIPISYSQEKSSHYSD